MIMSLHTHAWAYPERCVLLLQVKFNFLFNFPNTDQVSIAYGTTNYLDQVSSIQVLLFSSTRRNGRFDPIFGVFLVVVVEDISFPSC